MSEPVPETTVIVNPPAPVEEPEEPDVVIVAQPDGEVMMAVGRIEGALDQLMHRMDELERRNEEDADRAEELLAALAAEPEPEPEPEPVVIEEPELYELPDVQPHGVPWTHRDLTHHEER